MSCPQDPRRKHYRTKYAMSWRKASHLFANTALARQLDGCADEAARRLLLGVSKKQGTGNREQGIVRTKAA